MPSLLKKWLTSVDCFDDRTTGDNAMSLAHHAIGMKFHADLGGY